MHSDFKANYYLKVHSAHLKLTSPISVQCLSVQSKASLTAKIKLLDRSWIVECFFFDFNSKWWKHIESSAYATFMFDRFVGNSNDVSSNNNSLYSISKRPKSKRFHMGHPVGTSVNLDFFDKSKNSDFGITMLGTSVLWSFRPHQYMYPVLTIHNFRKWWILEIKPLTV